MKHLEVMQISSEKSTKDEKTELIVRVHIT